MSVARRWWLGAAGVLALAGAALACASGDEPRAGGGEKEEEGDDEAHLARLRSRMVEQQLARRDIHDPRVLEAMGAVPRHRFLPPERASLAYEDRAQSIGRGQTISQPYIVALMTQLAEPKPTDRALDVGTGSGYQAAVLSRLVARVDAIEIAPELAAEASARLRELGCANVSVRTGDGFAGVPEHAPFDLIIVAAAPTEVPPPLIAQLAPGGRLVIPVGEEHGQQSLLRLVKRPDGSITREVVAPVAFVPMTGRAQQPPSWEADEGSRE